MIRGLEFSDKLSGSQLFQFLEVFAKVKNEQDLYAEAIKIRDLHAERVAEIKAVYNPALREVSKLYMNSCSGKVIQRNFEKNSRLIFNDKQADEFEASSVPGSVSFGYCCEGFVILNGKKASTYSQRSSKPAQVGVYIYAHARRHMYENVYKYVECLYGDTDSVLFARS